MGWGGLCADKVDVVVDVMVGRHLEIRHCVRGHAFIRGAGATFGKDLVVVASPHRHLKVALRLSVTVEVFVFFVERDFFTACIDRVDVDSFGRFDVDMVSSPDSWLFSYRTLSAWR